MPSSRFFADKRRLFGLLVIASAACLVIGLLPWPASLCCSPARPLLAAVGAGVLVGALMLWWAPSLLDTYPRGKLLRILVEGVPPLVLYMLAIDKWPAVIDGIAPGGLRIAAALVPAALATWACVAFARYVHMLDELQQRLELVSLAAAAGLACVVGAMVAFLHLAGAIEVPGKAGFWVFPLVAVGYSLIRTVLTRRYG